MVTNQRQIHPVLGETPLEEWIGRYEQSHQNPVNRIFHKFGIPMIVVSLPLFLLSFSAKIRKETLKKDRLETAVFSVAKQRLPDKIREYRSRHESVKAFGGGKMTVGDAVEAYLRKVRANASLKPRSQDYRVMTLDFIGRSNLTLNRHRHAFLEIVSRILNDHIARV